MGERADGIGGRVGLVLMMAVAACSSPPPPELPSGATGPGATASATAAASAPTAATSTAPAEAAAPAPTAQRNTIVIHEADLFGEIQGRAGTTVNVLSLVATRAPPGAGVKGILLRSVEGGAETEWVHIADVTVKRESDGAGNLQLTITDEKKDALLGGKKVNHFVKGTRVKFRWEY
jgi:hypothetical protein